jgi:putative tryptophan/tyrosine transport system substrate-binding protein
MRRREFIAGLGAAAAGPVVASAQQAARMRRIGILLNASSDDPQYQAWVGAFLQELALLGWAIGRNVRIDTRWAGANAAEIRRHAPELVALAPDVILAHGAGPVGALLQATRTVHRSCSLSSSIPSVPAWSTAWRGRAATPPGSSCSNTA